MIKDTTYITPEYILGGIFPHVEGEKIEFKQNMFKLISITQEALKIKS